MPIPAPDDALVTADDLSEFPGAPFTESVVQAAAATVQAAAGWHIAPPLSETVTVDSRGGRTVMVETLLLTNVTEVRDITDDPAGIAITEYRTHPTTTFKAGIVDRPGGWPWGRVLELDIVHGHAACPDGLAAAIAELCNAPGAGALASRSLGDRSESWISTLSPTSQQAIAAYTIPGSP